MSSQIADSIIIKEVDILIQESKTHTNQNDFDKALEINEEAEKIALEKLGRVTVSYGNCCYNHSTILLEKSEYLEAEHWCLETIAIREKVLGMEHPDYAKSLDKLASLYRVIKKYEKAEILQLEAIRIQKKILGKNHPDYASSLKNLANLYRSMGRYEKAELLYLKAKAIQEKVLGKEHPDYALSLNNLAILYSIMKNYKKAERLYIEAIAIRGKALGKENPDYADSVFDLGGLYCNLGRYEKAESLNIEAITIRKKVFGQKHPSYIESLNNLANLYYLMGNYEKAQWLFDELAILNQNTLIKALRYLSERELINFLNSFTTNQNRILSFSQISSGKYLNSQISQVCFDNSLFYKGFVLNAAIRIKSLALLDTSSTEKFNLLKSYERNLAFEYSKPIEMRKNVSDLEEKIDELEKDLAKVLPGYSEAIRQVKWKEVQQKLKQGEAAIEFVNYQFYRIDKTDSIYYAALLLLPGVEQPEFIPLFEEKSLDSILHSHAERQADYANGLYSVSDRGVSPIENKKRSLFELLWKPLEKYLTEIKTIYFSPSGLLHRINLDAIPISNSSTIADLYQLIELNSTRQLVIPNQILNQNNEAILYGGVQFDYDSSLQKNDLELFSGSRGELSFSNVDSTLRGGTWSYLHGTESEVDSLDKIMQTAGLHITLIKGYDATEESFKLLGSSNNPSPRILHIATHGYFFPDPKIISQQSIDISQNEPVFKISEHPMLRSGLILSGGNAAWQGKHTLERREDGILTAYEISQMNLSNTELVVLSACETGLGDIQGNEGVYGLQRAFKIAGVKYLIMSLWMVPDLFTQELMVSFYKNWLLKNMTIPNAFHLAQKEMRERYKYPYFWAGFVLID